ncbi:hypothetical protein M9H77_22558 [Catharanthus roseus]|uniref:Uncharacterized protein n=1 Tax=Catharanthus roseus TaxID=4058 RepID=A0ACC0AQT5_CATRO|nr:hypothetical protein M9H77_22558 [Catharanthus roseus]
MLGRFTLDLDPVDRGRSTVGGLGPRRVYLMCLCEHYHLKYQRLFWIHYPKEFMGEMYTMMYCFLAPTSRVLPAKKTVTASTIASSAGMMTRSKAREPSQKKAQNTLAAPEASSFTKKDDESSSTDFDTEIHYENPMYEFLMAEDSTASLVLPIMVTRTLSTEDQLANLTRLVEDLVKLTQKQE